VRARKGGWSGRGVRVVRAHRAKTAAESAIVTRRGWAEASCPNRPKPGCLHRISRHRSEARPSTRVRRSTVRGTAYRQDRQQQQRTLLSRVDRASALLAPGLLLLSTSTSHRTHSTHLSDRPGPISCTAVQQGCAKKAGRDLSQISDLDPSGGRKAWSYEHPEVGLLNPRCLPAVPGLTGLCSTAHLLLTCSPCASEYIHSFPVLLRWAATFRAAIIVVWSGVAVLDPKFAQESEPGLRSRQSPAGKDENCAQSLTEIYRQSSLSSWPVGCWLAGHASQEKLSQIDIKK
jgi:hypothetical protein